MIWNPFRKLQKVEEKRSMPTVKFDPKRVTPAIQKDIQEFVLSFKEIRQDKRQSVVEASLEDLAGGGGNSHVVFTALQAAGVDRKVALRITDLVTKRSRWRLNTQRQIQTGLTEAEWMWSGAPCISSNPQSNAEKSMAEQHKNANGKRYDIREGLMIGGERQFPGLEYGCKCTSRIIMPGWND